MNFAPRHSTRRACRTRASKSQAGAGRRVFRNTTTALLALAAALLLSACQRVAETPREAWQHASMQCTALTSAATTRSGSDLTARIAAPHPTAVPVPGELLVAYRAPFAQSPGALGGGDAVGLGPSETPLSSDQALAATAAAVHAAHGLARLESDSAGLAFGLPERVRAADTEGALAGLRSDPRVLYAHPNYYLETLHVPSDALYSQQWHLNDFGMREAWDAFLGAASKRDVVVAIIDTGVDSTHPDLAAKMLPGWDFEGRDTDTSPGTSGAAAHGTHVAGIAAAIGDDAGVTGVGFAPEIRILPVKVFDEAGAGGTMADLILAIRWAAGLHVGGTPRNANPAQVINLSIGVAGTFPALDAAVQAAWQAGAVVVAAAGNRATGTADRGVLSPANAPCAIAVGSVDGNGQLSSFSITGPEVEIVAPGGYGFGGCGGILSTLPGGRYGCMSGTSMATPFVAGVAALMLSQGAASTPDGVRQLLGTGASTARSYPPEAAGHGLLCADAVLGASTSCGETSPEAQTFTAAARR